MNQAETSSVLEDIKRLKHERVEAVLLDPKVALLRRWQSRRLACTYSDLLNHPRYRPACLFFLDDIYAARDFSQRDHDIRQMYNLARRVIPEGVLRPMTLTVKLHDLTEELDQQLLDVLVKSIGITDHISEEQYVEAYRLCDNYDVRVQQIDMIYEINERLLKIVRSPLTTATLMFARGPIRNAGYVEMVDFLDRGYKAFKHMRGSHYFGKTIKKREMRILDRIYARDPDPFQCNMDGPEAGADQ